MKTIILAGGFGTRLSELTSNIPKPMVEVGGKPILCHIMNIYSAFQHNEFILALGYKAEVVKKYFFDYFEINNDLTVDLSNGEKRIHQRKHLDWKIHMVDTGLETQTGGRIKRLRDWVGGETFMMTYGDGLADISIAELVAFHKKHKRLATITAVRPPARFGGLVINGNLVEEFTEKNQLKEGWINGGFFVLEPEVFDYIDGDSIAWEKEPLERLAAEKQLMAFFHEGFWQPMDTLRECRLLESLWQSGCAPWIKEQKHLESPKEFLKRKKVLV